MSESRRQRRRKNRERGTKRAKLDAFREDFENLAAEGMGRPGMSNEEVLELVRIAADDMAQRMTREGMAARAPWGMTYNPQALRGSIQAGLLLFSSADDEMQNPRDVDEDQAQRTILEMMNGCITLAAAAVLYLRGVPLPFGLAKHMQSRQIDEQGRISD